MAELQPIPDKSLESGHEVRDVSAAFIVMLAIVFVFGGAILVGVLWRVEGLVVPEARSKGASPAVEMPGESPLNQRLKATATPRLEGLEPLAALPPSYRSSRPMPGGQIPDVRPEDLRANRQPILQQYGWVDRSKGIARIPIDLAMDAIVSASHKRPEKGKK